MGCGMMDRFLRIMRIVRRIMIPLCILTSVAVFVLWLQLPATVPVHFILPGQPDRYGSKFEILLVVILPLFGLLSVRVQEKEYHCADEQTKQKARREHQKAQTIRCSVQTAASVFLIIVTWALVLQW